MRNHYFRLFITLFLSSGFFFTPLLQAAQLSLPSGDLIAPEVSHKIIQGPLEAGASLQLKAIVTDNVGVKSVILYYRTKGAQDYKRAVMNRVGDSDEYAVTLGKNELATPGIEYYIQAMDTAGNSVLDGYSFSPLNVSVVSPGVPTAKHDKSLTGITQPSGEAARETHAGGKKKSKTWLWIALGALTVGVIAAVASGGGGSNGGDSGTGTVVVSSPTP